MAEVMAYRRAHGISDTIGAVILNIFLVGSAIVCFLPLLHVIATSLSSNTAANANQVGIIPVGFNVKAYAEAFRDTKMILSMLISMERIIIGVPFTMLITILCAYPLSHFSKDFPLRKFYSAMIVFTMLFNGGLIPTYILMTRLHLMNSIWALVLPGAVPVFNIVIMMNFFRQIPREMQEAASIDGADHFSILIKVMLPMSGAVMATLTLFCFVFHWNAWFDALIFMKDTAKYPLQNYMRTQIINMAVTDIEEARRQLELSKRALLFAKLFVSMIPIIVIYPFLQKYFKTGIVIGAVKG
ncbi:MAG: carbohydrate ABC transporter permease [Spirochaetaceae bacterium]|jgi:putative aldouronate transport system permease protein|nr:carbohydrate ABC transporter permease [Spirochaetaceae bacterium]